MQEKISMPKVKDSYLEARREEILDAATACFARKGFMHSTVPDICREANVSVGALYRYFPAKMDIIEASVQQHREDRARRLAAAEGEDTAQQTLEALFQLQTTRLLGREPDNNTAVRLHAFGEALYNPQVKDIVRRDLREIRGHLERMVRKAQRSGEIDTAFDPQAVAMLLNAISDGLIIQRIFVPDSQQYLEQALACVKALFVQGKACLSADGEGEEDPNGEKGRKPDY